jgi:hypothetical protein
LPSDGTGIIEAGACFGFRRNVFTSRWLLMDDFSVKLFRISAEISQYVHKCTGSCNPHPFRFQVNNSYILRVAEGRHSHRMNKWCFIRKKWDMYGISDR